MQNNINVIKNIPGRQLISQQRNLVEISVKQLHRNVTSLIQLEKGMLVEKGRSMRTVGHQFKNQNQTLSLLESKINLLDPINTLARGYSITRINGKAITSVTEINIGDSVETTVAEGKFTGTINEILK